MAVPQLNDNNRKILGGGQATGGYAPIQSNSRVPQLSQTNMTTLGRAQTQSQPQVISTAPQQKFAPQKEFLGRAKEIVKKDVGTVKSLFESLKQTVKKKEGDEGRIGAAAGRVLQKVGSKITPPKIPEKFKAKNKPLGQIAQTGGFQNPANAIGYYDEVVDFIAQFPGSVAQSWGRSLEMVSTKQGKQELKTGIKNLPSTMSEIKDHVQNKRWGEALTTAFSNPAVAVALDATDAIPVVGAAGMVAKKGVKTALKQLVKEVIEEGGEKTAKKLVQEGEQKLIKSAATTEVKNAGDTITVYRSAPTLEKGSQVFLKNDSIAKSFETPEQPLREFTVKSSDLETPLSEGRAKAGIMEYKGENVEPLTTPLSGTKTTPLPSPTEAKGENLKMIEEALASGDEKAARALYTDLPRDGYLPPFETIKKNFEASADNIAAKDANAAAKSVREGYGEFQKDVQNFKAKLRTAADQKNSSGMLNREHIPKSASGLASDDVAARLGMSEGDFMAKLMDELDIKKGAVPKAPKKVEVSRDQLPVGEGVEKASRLEARITESLDKTPQEIRDQLGSTYNQMNKKENIAKASSYVTEKPNEALAVLRGEKEAPPGILKNSIYVAMENAAYKDADLARKLASLSSTRAGQELSILTEIDPHSPVKMMRELVDIREAAFKSKHGNKPVKEVTKKIVKEIKEKVKKPDKYDWNKFIESIKC